MGVRKEDRELGVKDASAIELTADDGSARMCWPCFAIAAIPASALLALNLAAGLVGEDGWLRAPMIVLIVVYALLFWAQHKGEVGDAPDTRVFVSSQSLWFKPFQDERFSRVDLRHVVSVTVQSASGRAWVQFIRVEWALTPGSARNTIEFVPHPRYRFEANGDNPACRIILDRVIGAREAEAEAEATAAAGRASGIVLDLRAIALNDAAQPKPEQGCATPPRTSVQARPHGD